ncbi:MAG: PucR family transcriptional regulator ligand-binding domain-containing protein [Solirubrobacterales bacterium]|nr:PucR family transcriptional regulator ligand-binding domain-containing protein [Solirubrobacterales bacterium]
MLTVGSLLDEFGLELAVDGAADNQIRWVHISELDDPTPFLSGGELLLTNAINLKTAAKQRRFVRSLADAGAAALGVAVGLDHAELPPAMVDEAGSRALPIFELPFELPFIAITRWASTRLIEEGYEALERSVEVHALLEGLVLAERGLPEVMRAIADSVSGASLLIDDRGIELARHPQERGISQQAVSDIRVEVNERAEAGRQAMFVAERGTLAGRAIAVPVPVGGHGGRRHWLVLARRRGEIGDLERLLARQAAMVVALELMRERAVRETERRLAGDVLAEALGGQLGDEDLRGRLQPFGIEGRVAVLLFELDESADDAVVLADSLRAPALVAVNAAAGRPLLCAIVDSGDRDPIELAREGRSALAASGRTVRAAASRPVQVGALRRAFHEARCALEATAMANGNAPEVASHRDLGAFTLLLSLQDDEALRTYADNLLGPISEGEGEYGPELLRSLEAFIERNGQWERAARDLYCHRHTLRYRIRRIEELTGRDLGQAQDRIELWLALRARELVR